MTSRDSSNPPQEMLQKFSRWLDNWVRPVVQFLIYLRVQVGIAVAAWAIFSQVDQTIELYRAITLSQDVAKAGLSTACVTVLAIFVWYTARRLELQYPQRYPECFDGAVKLDRLDPLRGPTVPLFQGDPPGFYKKIPRLLGVVPLISFCAGLQSGRPLEEGGFWWIWFLASGGVTLCTYLLFVQRVNLFDAAANQVRAVQFLAASQAGQGLFSQTFENGFVNVACLLLGILALPLIRAATGTPWSWGWLMIVLLASVLNSVLLTWQRNADQRLSLVIGWIGSLVASIGFGLTLPATLLPTVIGSVSIFAIALTIILVFASVIYNWGLDQRPKFPVLAIALVLVVTSSALNWNDNHRFRQLPKLAATELPALESSFQQWLSSRPDRQQFATRPYPVYLVSAQGGGIYAAYHAATTLAKLTEYYPTFAQHTFVISGVSGGSLGSAGFASLVQAGETGSALREKAKQLFGSDLLSPLLTMGLFPDLIQRLLPFPVLAWDRATGLEVALEAAWDQLGITAIANPFRQSFYQHWQPQSLAPALALNTTVVETGDRLVISPFKIPLPNDRDAALNEPTLDLRLSTAAGLSARFPYFTPVGWYEHHSDQGRVRFRLADGGYFDNSGIPTALDIGRALQRIQGYDQTFKVIYLSLIDQPLTIPVLKSAGLNELLSPLRALFSAREARSRSAVELSTFTVNNGVTNPLDPRYRFRTLFLKKSDADVSLPLGWLLSGRSQTLIDAQILNPTQFPCEPPSLQPSQPNRRYIGQVPVESVDHHNRCAVAAIGQDLR